MKRLTKIYTSGSYGIVGDIDDAVHRLAACEAIQVAAMCRKFVEMEGKT